MIDWYDPSRAAEVFGRFEQLLHRHGIVVRSGSPLERFALATFEISYGRRASARDYTRDVRDLYRELIGLAELAAIVLAVEDHSNFPTLIKHLRLLNSGNPIHTAGGKHYDSDSDKLFELFVACLVMRCGDDVDLEDPWKSSGVRNPDVLATIRGQRWGFACKALHSASPQSIIDNIQKGVEQIELSAAERGVVILATRSILDHHAYWPIVNTDDVAHGAEPKYRCFRAPEDAKNTVVRDVQLIGKSLVDHGTHAGVTAVFNGKKASPGMLFWAHTTACLYDGSKPRAMSLRFMNYQHARPTEPTEQAVFECLDRAAAALNLSAG